MTKNKTPGLTRENWREWPAIALHLRLESYGPTAVQLPTFQDVGNAVYGRPDGQQNGILDTHGSLANRLEAVVWDEANDRVIDCLAEIPFVTVHTKGGNLLTTSLHESHRLNSPYIFKSKLPNGEIFEPWLGGQIKATGGDRRKLAAVLAKIDPMSLIHGTFMSYSKAFEVGGSGAKITAALSGFVEATNVQPVEYGAQKFDRIDSRQKKEDKADKADKGGYGTSKEGFGTFQASATLWSPESIDAYFYLDVDLLRSYQLGEAFTDWAIAVSLLKVLRFIERGLRLRSRCILQPQITEDGNIALEIKLPLTQKGNYFEQGFPQQDALTEQVENLTEQLKAAGVFGEALVLTDAVTDKE